MDAEGQADASELVQSLLAPAPSEVFCLQKRQPDGSIRGYKVRVQYLRTEENMQVLLASQKYAKELGEIERGYGDIYKESQAVEVLVRALRHVDKRTRPDGTEYYPPLFVTPQQLRESFLEAELAQCLNMYELVKAKYSCVEDFRPEAIDVWAARLSDTLLGPLFLSQMDFSQLPALATSLALRVRELSEKAGQPLPNLLDSLASQSDSSDSGTIGFSSLPGAQWNDGNPLPSTRLLTSQEARAELGKSK